MSDDTAAPKGPASYFPGIVARYGQPIDHWLALIRDHGPAPHMQIVDWLKTTHGLGHGHANALVAYVRAKDGWP
jgi:hypothetical protein